MVISRQGLRSEEKLARGSSLTLAASTVGPTTYLSDTASLSSAPALGCSMIVSTIRIRLTSAIVSTSGNLRVAAAALAHPGCGPD